MDDLTLNFKPIMTGFSFIEEDHGDLVFYNRHKYIFFSGASVPDFLSLIPLLTGKHSCEQIAEKLEFPIEYTCEIIKVLIEKNIVQNYDLSNNPRVLDMELQRYQNFITKKTGTYASFFEDLEKTFSKKITIVGNNELKNELKDKLGETFEFIELEQVQTADLIIAVDFYENKTLFKEVNELSREYNIPFLRTLIQDERFVIGPLFIPSVTSCYSCYLSRTISNYENPILKDKYESRYNEESKDSHLSIIPGTISMFSSHAYSFILKYFSEHLGCQIVGKEFVYNVYNLDSSLNPVLKVPGCNVCGDKYQNLIKDFCVNS